MSINNSITSNNTNKEKKERIDIKNIVSGKSIKYIFIALILVGISIGLSFILGQLTYSYFETNASNLGYLYSIIFSSISFFFFVKFSRKNMDINELRKFIVIYFLIYFMITGVILIFLADNVSYFYSTAGASLILFSIYILIIFLMNPGILGIAGSFKQIFSTGKQVRVIVVYLFIVFMQVFGFSLLNYAISWFASFKGYNPAYNIPNPPGEWFDFLYFSFITFVTIGYGDIHPLSRAAKFSAIIQAVEAHIISILFLAILFVYISSTLEANSDDESDTNK